jgi:hypothetical protein
MFDLSVLGPHVGPVGRLLLFHLLAELCAAQAQTMVGSLQAGYLLLVKGTLA